MDLAPKIDSGQYAGVVTFSDIHAHAKKLKKGIRYAIKNNLFIVFLGDLVDGHDKPLETVSVVKKLLDEDRAVLVIGNHDDKFRRYAIGNPVQLKKAQKQTIEDVPEKHRDEFLQMMVDVTTHKNAALTHRIHDVVFVHGSAHRTLWDDEANLDNLPKKAQHRALYGEVNGERDENDFPVRLYNWVDEIPDGKHVVVGHDRKPMGNKLKKTGPHTQPGLQGGKATFTDMGCGKGGKLCLAVFEPNESGHMEMTKHEAI
jgi:calcineurin-like phosphoesterase family protein